MSTATAPGLAGFGAQSAQDSYAQPSSGYNSQGYENLDQPYNDTAPTAAGAQSGYYFDPKQAYDYAEDDAYGGYDVGHEPPNRHERVGSEGSIAARESQDRSLKVTNV